MNAVTKDFASQAGHFYARDGSPAYEVKKKDGGMRPTHVGDARKAGLYPSVTTILKLMDKPGLTNWLIDQAILAALTLPRAEGEAEADWLKRVKNDAKEQGWKAAERGTQIHAAVEKLLTSNACADLGEWTEHAIGAVACVGKETGYGIGDWNAEKSAVHPLGYGCKTDAIRDGWTLDFKSKEFDAETKLSTYEEHAIQLIANSQAHGFPDNRCAIVYVSATSPGLCRFIEVERSELDRGWAMFQALLELWIAKTGYNPRAFQ